MADVTSKKYAIEQAIKALEANPELFPSAPRLGGEEGGKEIVALADEIHKYVYGDSGKIKQQ
jgi:hypothetical protein